MRHSGSIQKTPAVSALQSQRPAVECEWRNASFRKVSTKNWVVVVVGWATIVSVQRALGPKTKTNTQINVIRPGKASVYRCWQSATKQAYFGKAPAPVKRSHTICSRQMYLQLKSVKLKQRRATLVFVWLCCVDVCALLNTLPCVCVWVCRCVEIIIFEQLLIYPAYPAAIYA